MLKARIHPGVYRMRNGGSAEIWARDAEGNPLYPFYGSLPESPDEDAWGPAGDNWASRDYDLVERIGPLPRRERS